MFGNYIGNPYISNMSYSPMMGGMMRSAPMMGSMMRSAPMMNMGMGSQMIGGTPRAGGFLSSLFRGGTGATGLTKSFNFGNLLNGASKTLGIVREAIPIVKEVGPMMGNMKQMMKIASIFKDETDTTSTRNNTNSNTNNSANIDKRIETKENDTTITSTNTNINQNEPNFFL